MSDIFKVIHPLYENEHYMVFPCSSRDGYFIKNKATGVREGTYEKLTSAITGADVTNELLIKIYKEKADD